MIEKKNHCFNSSKSDCGDELEAFSIFLAARQLLVIDEAHNIELQLSKFIEVTISERFAKTVLKLAWPGSMTLKQSVDWVRNVYLPKLSSHVKFVKKGIEKD